MNEHTAAPMRRPRTDTRLLDDITLGLSGYWAVLVAHDSSSFLCLRQIHARSQRSATGYRSLAVPPKRF
jgi:hypothetical protein